MNNKTGNSVKLTKIIEEFNAFLEELAKKCSDNKYDIWAVDYHKRQLGINYLNTLI